MKIAIIGVGNVGGTLAKKLGKQGHTLYLGVRDPKSEKHLKLAKEIGAPASVHPVKEAVSQADIIILATPWKETEGVVKSIAEVARGKVLIDCTNPLKPDLSGLELGFNTSAGENVQLWAPEAHVFKAFNSTGCNITADPLLESRKSAMFFCGNDQKHRNVVADLIKDVGFEVFDIGPLTSARLLESLALLWIQCAYVHGFGRDFAFGILRRK